jgi:hypothetical protein
MWTLALKAWGQEIHSEFGLNSHENSEEVCLSYLRGKASKRGGKCIILLMMGMTGEPN